MTQDSDVRTVLVTAATGKTGRRVVERLARRGFAVRAGSRGGGTLFDWEREETWGPALEGAELVYAAYYPDLAAPGAAEALGVFGRLAAGAGVRRLVLLSGRGEPEAARAEEELRRAAAGVEVAVVRAAFFVQNFTEGALAEGVAAGAFTFPAGSVAEPFVDVDDVADVVVAALVEDGHAGAVHELTGPRPVTFAEAAAELGAALGREVRYVPVSRERYAAELAGYGLPEPQAAWLAELFASLLDGHNASVTDGVRRVLGREPREFADAVKAAFAPGAGV